TSAPLSYPLSLHDALPILSFLPREEAGHFLPREEAGPVCFFDAGGQSPPAPSGTCFARSLQHSREPVTLPAASPAQCTFVHQWRSEEHTSELQSRFDLVCR